MKSYYKIYIILLLINLLFACSDKKEIDSKQKKANIKKSEPNKTIENEKPKDRKLIINKLTNQSSAQPKKMIWKYYKKWNDNKNLLYDIIDYKNNMPKLYYKVGYQKKKPVLIIAYNANRKNSKLKLIYNTRGRLRKKILFTETKELGKIKVLSELSTLGYKIRETIYRRSDKKIKERELKVMIKEFTIDESLSKLIIYDNQNQVKTRSTFKYDNTKKPLSKTVYSRDIKLMGSIDYYQNIYKDYTEYYNRLGQVYKKEWYHKDEAPNNLYFIDKYVYLASGNKLVNSYDTTGKLIHKKEFNKKGDIITSELFN